MLGHLRVLYMPCGHPLICHRPSEHKAPASWSKTDYLPLVQVPACEV